MSRFLKKTIIKLLLIVYCLVNFATFSNASVCIAKDHIGFKLFGIDTCCIARQEVIVTDGSLVMMSDVNCIGHCISSSCSGMVPDYKLMLRVSDSATVWDIPQLCNLSEIYFTNKNSNIKQFRTMNIGYLDKLRTVRLTI